MSRHTIVEQPPIPDPATPSPPSNSHRPHRPHHRAWAGPRFPPL